MSDIAYRRYPRKLKKQMSRTSLEFEQMEWIKIKEAARLRNMRPSQFIHYALLETLKRTENVDTQENA